MSPGREPAEPQQSIARYRLQITKRGNAKYLSHLDTVRALLRSFRRARIPMALSGGYNPQPKVAYATALAVGLESEAEYVDVELTRQVEPVSLARAVADQLPVGFGLREVRTVSLRRPSVASYQAVSRYTIGPLDLAVRPGTEESTTRALPAGVEAKIAELLAATDLTVARHGNKRVNIRPYIVGIEAERAPGTQDESPDTESRLTLELLSDQRGAARVDEVLRLLGLDPAQWRAIKTDFWPLDKGARISPWRA